MIVDLDGELIAAEDARVSPFDAAYQYGDGVFDTLRAYRGFLFCVREHFERIARQVELLQLPVDPRVDAWHARLHRLLEANQLTTCDARVRIQIGRGGGPDTDLVGGDPEAIPPVVFITARPVAPSIQEWQSNGIHVLSMQASFSRGNFPQLKTLNYLPSLMAQRFASAQGYQEACLLNRQNRVLEGATSNLFCLRGRNLRTPPLRMGILPGVTRAHVLQLAAKAGLNPTEEAFELRDLLLADEVFITGSVKEIVPVVRVDRATIGRGHPGTVTRFLQQAYRDSVEQARTFGWRARGAPPGGGAAGSGAANEAAAGGD
jgi:branched-chain amino acid aminotransferase